MPGLPRYGRTLAAASRSRRFARLRVTALPTFRLAVNPTLMLSAPAQPSGCGAACRTRPGPAVLQPAAATRRKSARIFSVSSLAATEVSADCERPGVSRGQMLAALCAARRQHPAPCHGCHPRPEPVATLANELARL